MKKTTAVLAAANLLALVQAAPLEPVCKVVTVTSTGVPFWKPQPDPTTSWGEWPAWSTTTSKKPDASTKSSTDPWVAWASTVSKTPAASTKTSSVDPWTAWTTTGAAQPTESTPPAVTTTTKPIPQDTTTTTTSLKDHPEITTSITTTTTPTTTSETTTTTTAPPRSTATCPASSGTSVLAGGSCSCSFDVNCDSHAGTDANSKFWEQTSGALVSSLAECLSICDNNAKCEAALWVDDATAGPQDYHRCWQVSGLLGIVGNGYGQISYKGTCSGTCSNSYNS